MYTIFLTSDRPSNLPCGYHFMPDKCSWSRLFVNEMAEKLKQIAAIKGPLKILSGLSLGADQLWFLAALRAKRKGADITIEACLPCNNYSSNWPDKLKYTYKRLIQLADQTIYTSTKEYTDQCLIDRDIYMVSKADLIIALWDKKPPNNNATIRFAKRFHKHIIHYKPDSLLTT